MFCWNKKAINILENYFKTIKETNKINFNFVLLDWVKWLWKTTIIKELVKKFLWENYKTDFLEIKDLSKYIWKNHILKVNVDEKDQVEKTLDWNFKNLWTRNIRDRLSLSSFWKYKIVFLENIERMTISSANAFLKIFEEPLENRIIIATTTNVKKILDTIVSRAFVVKFDIPKLSETKKYIQNLYSIDETKIDTLLAFLKWKPWLIIKYCENQNLNKEENEKLDIIISKYKVFLNLMKNKWYYSDKIQLLVEVEKLWYLDLFLESLIFYYSSVNDIEKLEKLLSLKKMSNINVWSEKLLFNFVLD